MACRRARSMTVKKIVEVPARETEAEQGSDVNAEGMDLDTRVLFGVDSLFPANDSLQNNLTLYDWVCRNKLSPNFWGRNINGENALTTEEIQFIHKKGCTVVPVYLHSGAKDTEGRGESVALAIKERADELGIFMGHVVFLKIDGKEDATTDFLRGFADGMLEQGLIPGFMADTDSVATFNREFSRGMHANPELFGKCLIWAMTPTAPGFENMTDSHTINPDVWKPYAPSVISRNEIDAWQYGKNCHPAYDDAGKQTMFNLDLTCDMVLISKAL